MSNEELAGLGDRLRSLLGSVDPALLSALDDRTMEAITEDFLAQAAAQRWMAQQVEKTRIRAMDFAHGAAMELIPAEETAAMWVGICRGLLQGAPNYSESKFFGEEDGDGAKIVMETRLPKSSETFTVTVQRHGPGKLTPHEARMKAEKAVEATWEWIGNANNGLGRDPDDLGFALTELGFPPPPEDEEE